MTRGAWAGIKDDDGGRGNQSTDVSASAWRAPAAVFLDPRVLIILLLGFSSGLPLALSGSTLLLWMKDVGVDLGTIGLFALVGLPYTIKFLWAPIVDAFQVPVLSRLLGHRRGWLLFSQFLLIAAILLLAVQDPVKAPWLVALAAVIVATASATQDIVIDAFRVEYLPVENQAAGMAYFVAAYRIGMLVSTAGAVALVAYLEYAGVAKDLVWTLRLCGHGGTGGGRHRGGAARQGAARQGARGRGAGRRASEPAIPWLRFYRAAYAAFADFFTKRDALLILLFVVLFKLTDALAGVMTGPFVLDIGFDKASYAAIIKGVGLAASLIGGVAGGLLARARAAVARAAGGGHAPGGGELHLRLAGRARRQSRGAGAGDLDGEFHQRHRHGGVHRLSLGAVHQPGLYRDAVRPVDRARLGRAHHAGSPSGLSRRIRGLGVVLHLVCCRGHSRTVDPMAADHARRFHRDRAQRARRGEAGDAPTRRRDTHATTRREMVTLALASYR